MILEEAGELTVTSSLGPPQVPLPDGIHEDRLEDCFACQYHPNDPNAEELLKVFKRFSEQLLPGRNEVEVGLGFREFMDTTPGYKNIDWSAERIAHHLKYHVWDEDLMQCQIRRMDRDLVFYLFNNSVDPNTKELNNVNFNAYFKLSGRYVPNQKQMNQKRGGGKSQNVHG